MWYTAELFCLEGVIYKSPDAHLFLPRVQVGHRAQQSTQMKGLVATVEAIHCLGPLEQLQVLTYNGCAGKGRDSNGPNDPNTDHQCPTVFIHEGL